MPFCFTVGAEFLYNGIHFKVWPQKEPGYISAQRQNDLDVVQLPMDEVLMHPSFRKLDGFRQRDEVKRQQYWALPENVQQIVDRRLKAIESMILLWESLAGNEASRKKLFTKYPQMTTGDPDVLPTYRKIVATLSETMNCGERTLWRWFKEFKKSGIEGLVPTKRLGKVLHGGSFVEIIHPGNGDVLQRIPVKMKSDVQIKVIEEVIQKEYLKKTILVPGDAINEINQRLLINGQPEIPRRTLFDIINKINKQTLIKVKMGERQWKNSY